jgi:hypothetical protein
MSSKPLVRQIAQVKANYACRNYNIAYELLNATNFTAIPAALRQRLHFPADDEALVQFKSFVLTQSLDSDIEKEVDITLCTIDEDGTVIDTNIKVKHRDIKNEFTNYKARLPNGRWVWKQKEPVVHTSYDIEAREKNKQKAAAFEKRRLEELQFAQANTDDLGKPNVQLKSHQKINCFVSNREKHRRERLEKKLDEARNINNSAMMDDEETDINEQ